MSFETPEPESSSNDRWLNSFANLMMLLFALFVVLFASSKADVKKLEEVAQSLRSALDAKSKPQAAQPSAAAPVNEADLSSGELQAGLAGIVESLFREANPEAKGPQTWVEFEDLGEGAFLLRISPEGLFRPGEARVDARMRPLLDRLGELIRKSSRKLKIEGHADYEDSELLSRVSGSAEESFSAKNTWELSALRSAWVAQYWMRKFDFDPAKMEVTAFGKYRPMAPGKTARAVNNRRLEVVIEKKDERTKN